MQSMLKGRTAGIMVTLGFARFIVNNAVAFGWCLFQHLPAFAVLKFAVPPICCISRGKFSASTAT
jgi:hypothetical protein